MASQAFEPQPTPATPVPEAPHEAGGPPAESGPFQAALAAAIHRDPKEVGSWQLYLVLLSDYNEIYVRSSPSVRNVCFVICER